MFKFYYHKACYKWESINPIKGRMPRIHYLVYGMGAAIILGLSVKIYDALFQIDLIGLLLAYLASSLFIFHATVKRLQDINKCGFNAFLMFIPGVNQMFFLYLLSPRGTDGDNAYGADPLFHLKD